jgi:hypothetical protein
MQQDLDAARIDATFKDEEIMFRLPGWSLIAAVLLSSIGPAPAAEPTLPPTATSEEAVWLTRFDLTTLKAADLRAAAEATLGADDAKLIEPMIESIETRFGLLAGQGAQMFLVSKCYGPATDEIPNREYTVMHWAPGADHLKVGEQVVEAMYGREFSHIFATRWDGDWLTVYDKKEQPRVDDGPAKRAARFEAAYQSLGKRPGMILVPSDRLREHDREGRDNADEQKDAPASAAAVNDAIMNCEWGSMTVKLGKEPAIRFIVEMGDEAKAKKFLADFQRLQQNLRKSPDIKLSDIGLMTASALKVPPTLKGTRVSCLFDAKTAQPLVDATILAPFKPAKRIAAEKRAAAKSRTPAKAVKPAKAGGDTDVRVALYGLSIHKPGQKEVAKGETTDLQQDDNPLGQPGTRLLWTIRPPRDHSIAILGDPEIVACKDDHDKSLMDDDIKTSIDSEQGDLFEVSFPRIPSPGAKKIFLDGTIAVVVRQGEKVVEQRDVRLEKGAKITAGPVPMQLLYVDKSADFPPVKLSTAFRSKQPLYAIKSIAVLNPDGKEITHRMYPRADDHIPIELTEAPETCTVRIVYFERAEEVILPLDTEISLGF